jgi:hypothetical protein
MKTKRFYHSSVAFLLIILLMVSHTKLSAQGDVNRRLSVAVNGFDFNEAGQKKQLPMEPISTRKMMHWVGRPC